MYIFTTLEFSTHYSEFHLLTTSVNAKYYYKYVLKYVWFIEKKKESHAHLS